MIGSHSRQTCREAGYQHSGHAQHSLHTILLTALLLEVAHEWSLGIICLAESEAESDINIMLLPFLALPLLQPPVCPAEAGV